MPRTRNLLLDPEWARIELLVAMAEALRTGTPPEEDYNLFADVDWRVAEGREAGSWGHCVALSRRSSKIRSRSRYPCWRCRRGPAGPYRACIRCSPASAPQPSLH